MSTQRIELDFLEARRQMEILFDADVPVLLRSDPGQGKTSMIRQYADEQGPDYGLFELNGALSNQPDFAGWFYRCSETHVDYDGNEVNIEAGRYTFPYFGFDKRSGRPWFQFKRGVIVLEEYGQTEVDLKRALGQTTLEKRVGQHQVPEGFNVVMLSNYEGGRDAVTREFDFMINRRAEINMRLSLDSWLLWAHANRMTNITMAFAAMPAHEVFTGKAPKDQGPWLTPRSLATLDRYVRKVVERKIPFNDAGVLVAAGGIIGRGAAQQFLTFGELRDKIPTVRQIIADPDKCPVPDSTDKQMFVVFNMADEANKNNIDQLVTYMQRLPSDLAISFYRNALTSDKSLMSCRAFGDWAVANKQLLAVVSSRI
jgi:hypothetical protein